MVDLRGNGMHTYIQNLLNISRIISNCDILNVSCIVSK